MANTKQIKALLKAHMDDDDDHFFAVAMQVAASEAKQGHGKIAEELRKIIDDAKTKRHIDRTKAKTTPIAQPRGELADLLEVSYPKNVFPQMILAKPISTRLERIIKEQRHYPKIRSHGLTPRRKLLLVGPPGTGKTMTASALAGELGIPLFLVRLDRLITKFMGETAAKLRVVFEAVKDVRGVYFFDEFDAIGSQRGLVNDVGEIRRVLNSFLKMLEQDDSNSVIVAATNHPDILDYALFRRFDDVIEYSLPSSKEVEKLLKNKLTGFVSKHFTWEHINEVAQKLSYAEISRAAEEAMKDAIIHDREYVTEDELLQTLKERISFTKKK
ncbi:MAG: ATP-binding protein [Candidatus Thiodiazotropha sp.]